MGPGGSGLGTRDSQGECESVMCWRFGGLAVSGWTVTGPEVEVEVAVAVEVGIRSELSLTMTKHC